MKIKSKLKIIINENQLLGMKSKKKWKLEKIIKK